MVDSESVEEINEVAFSLQGISMNEEKLLDNNRRAYVKLTAAKAKIDDSEKEEEATKENDLNIDTRDASQRNFKVAKDTPESNIEQEHEKDQNDSAESSGEVEAVQESEISIMDNPLATEIVKANIHYFKADDGTKNTNTEAEVKDFKLSENATFDDHIEPEKIVEDTDGISKEQRDPSDADRVNHDKEQENKLELYDSAAVHIHSSKESKAIIRMSKTSDDAGLSTKISSEDKEETDSSANEVLSLADVTLKEDNASNPSEASNDNPNSLKSWQLILDESSTPAEPEKPEADYALEKPNDGEGEILRGWSREGDDERGSFVKMARKAGVAVTGGALVIVGLPMIPMPTPGGVIVVGSGMAVLATEFPAARRALDRSRQGLANMVGDESDDDEEKKKKKKKAANIAKLVFEDEDVAKKKLAKNKAKRILNPLYRSQKGQPVFNNDDLKEFKDKTTKAARAAKKNVKGFIRGTVLPLMERMTSSSDGAVSSKSEKSIPQHRLRSGSRGKVKPPPVIRTPRKTVQKNINDTGIHEF